MPKHEQTKADAKNEANGDIPANREFFYFMENQEVDPETGLLHYESAVDQNYGSGRHSLTYKAQTLKSRREAKLETEIVEAETCEHARLHFVRIKHPLVGEVTRTYVWDKNH